MVALYAWGAAAAKGQTMMWYVPCGGFDVEAVSPSLTEPLSAETELPSGLTMVRIRSAAPVNEMSTFIWTATSV